MSFQAKALQYDPYRKFKFLVKWDGQPILAVSKVTALKKKVEAIDYRSGGDPNFVKKAPGLTSYEPITLERGVSASPEFRAWVNLVNKHQMTGGTSDEHFHTFRKNITIELYNLASERVMSIQVHNAWPSEFIALPDLDAKTNEIAIETLVLVHEGWEINDVIVPTEDHL